jgi:serine protease AprX
MDNTGNIICPLCNDTVDKLLYRFHIDSERLVIDRIKIHNPSWSEEDGTCSRCVDYYQTEIVLEQRILPEIGPYFPVKSADDFVILPTAVRLDADPRFTGKGITICFIDSGFYPHPDLTAQCNRIKAIVDLTGSGAQQQNASQWHGTMTSVVCAGDGYLSNGLYKGIASDAELVLLKVQDDQGKIATESIIKALQWVLENHTAFGIRIVNMSLGGDDAISHKESGIDKLAEELIALGIVIVAAVGNDENSVIKPPANALNVIAVGGIDDENKLDHSWTAYHSSYGKTVDALMKPELVAHAIWIAAPILPGSAEQQEALSLYELVKTPNELLFTKLQACIGQIKSEAALTRETPMEQIRAAIIDRIRKCKYIAPHYMHVDGTSFAAPIVCAVIAQLLEINPELTPAAIRHILFSSAKRISSIDVERQGYGIIQPRKAILQVLKRETILKTHDSPHIDKKRNSIAFFVQNDCASQISLAGSFNQWAQNILLLEPHKNGMWKIEIPLLPAGRYQYKFFIDDQRWAEDVDNPYREPDGLAGFNSVLVIEN